MRSLNDPWTLGGIELPNRVVLAPLAGIGNWFVRLQAKRYGAGLAVSETSKNKAAALEFIRFLYDTDRYAKTMNDSNSMPSTKSAAQQVKDPVLKQMTSWLVQGNGCPHILFGKGSSATADPLAALIAGSTGPEQTAKNMQKAVKSARG